MFGNHVECKQTHQSGMKDFDFVCVCVNKLPLPVVWNWNSFYSSFIIDIAVFDALFPDFSIAFSKDGGIFEVTHLDEFAACADTDKIKVSYLIESSRTFQFLLFEIALLKFKLFHGHCCPWSFFSGFHWFSFEDVEVKLLLLHCQFDLNFTESFSQYWIHYIIIYN